MVVTADSQLDGFPLELACDLCWSLSMVGWQVDWTRERTRTVLKDRYAPQGPSSVMDADCDQSQAAPVVVAPDALIRLAWSVAVLNEPIPVPLLQEICDGLEGSLPVDFSGLGLRMLQEIALHIALPGGLSDCLQYNQLPLTCWNG